MKESFKQNEMPREESKEKSVWKTLRNMKNAVAFAALLAFAAPGITSAQEKETRPEGTKISDVEKGIEKAREDVVKIAEGLKIKGREGKGNTLYGRILRLRCSQQPRLLRHS